MPTGVCPAPQHRRRRSYYVRQVLRRGAPWASSSFAAIATLTGVTLVGIISAILSQTALVGITFGLLTLLALYVAGSYRTWDQTDRAYSALLARGESPRRTLALKNLIAVARERGDDLLHSRHTGAPNIDAAVQWETDTYNLIAASVGEGEARIFAGGTPVRSRERRQPTHSSWFIQRMDRLDQLVSRADHLAVRDDFEPAQWATIFEQYE